ncbi:MAG: cytidylate kinase-like family protein [Actinobacteria bacterium]|nr:cytidylate kinase-like family protein [Actinomycetota bacterium]
MPVITVSRQLGSHGARIARQLAAELGFDFVDKSTINKVIRQYGVTRLDVLHDHKPKIWELFNADSATTIEMMNQTIAAFAARGNVVILGRGGFRVLQDMADVVNVFIKAPDAVRARRIAKRNSIAPGEAAELIKADDELRARFVRLFYNAGWADESGFDLVIDSEASSDAEAIAQIRTAVAALPADGARSASALEVDPVLARTAATVLARKASKA